MYYIVRLCRRRAAAVGVALPFYYTDKTKKKEKGEKKGRIPNATTPVR